MVCSTTPRYRRVIYKVSGESLGKRDRYGSLSPERFEFVVDEIAAVHAAGVQVVVVVGGGNVLRGGSAEWKIARADADEVGILATGVNGAMLAALLRARAFGVMLLSRGAASGVGQPYDCRTATAALERQEIVINAGGMGVPLMSSDYPAVHLAVETDAQAVLMAKSGVDGVYDADPQICATARRLPTVTADEAIAGDLRVMDMSALVLARDHGITIHVFSAGSRLAAKRVVMGEPVGSIITP